MYPMTITVPSGWIKVSDEGLEEFLKTCADYRSECYIGARRYSYAHNGKAFCVIKNDAAYVDPGLLVK